MISIFGGPDADLNLRNTDLINNIYNSVGFLLIILPSLKYQNRYMSQVREVATASSTSLPEENSKLTL
jgi:hypothetical protein